MLNPLTGKVTADLYEVTIYHGKHPIFSTTIKSTNEEEAVVKATNQLKTRVKKLHANTI